MASHANQKSKGKKKKKKKITFWAPFSENEPFSGDIFSRISISEVENLL